MALRSLSPPAALAALLFCAAAAAPTPYPAATDLPTIAAWLATHTRVKPEQVVAAGPDSVFVRKWCDRASPRCWADARRCWSWTSTAPVAGC